MSNTSKGRRNCLTFKHDITVSLTANFLGTNDDTIKLELPLLLAGMVGILPACRRSVNWTKDKHILAKWYDFGSQDRNTDLDSVIRCRLLDIGCALC